MTIPEFISHLDTQPWASNYVSNFFAFEAKHKRHSRYLFHDFINDAFTWDASPEGHTFWSDIYSLLNYTCKCELFQLKSALHSHYSSTHPELFI